MPSIKIISVGIVGVLAFALLGYLGFRASYYENQYLKAQSELKLVAWKVAGGEGVTRGTLVSADPVTKFILLRTPDPYTGVGTKQYFMPILHDTVILKQTVAKSSGIGVSGIASSSPISSSPISIEELASLPAGTHVKFVAVPGPNDEPVLMTLVVGDEPF